MATELIISILGMIGIGDGDISARYNGAKSVNFASPFIGRDYLP
jgi:hypothetical protein